MEGMDSGPLVLVVDDDEDVRETVRMILEDEGYATDVVDDGRSAMTRLRRAPRPALILLDLQMPEMDGRAVLRALEADAELASIPVVLITASGETAETTAFPYPLLRKPFDLDRFLEVVAMRCPRLWDEDEPPTDETAGRDGLTSTIRDRCVVCSAKASSRCVACGEALCARCLDAGPDGRCASCWRARRA